MILQLRWRSTRDSNVKKATYNFSLDAEARSLNYAAPIAQACFKTLSFHRW
jgi:hypothetical protein